MRQLSHYRSWVLPTFLKDDNWRDFIDALSNELIGLHIENMGSYDTDGFTGLKEASPLVHDDEWIGAGVFNFVKANFIRSELGFTPVPWYGLIEEVDTAVEIYGITHWEDTGDTWICGSTGKISKLDSAWSESVQTSGVASLISDIHARSDLILVAVSRSVATNNIHYTSTGGSTWAQSASDFSDDLHCVSSAADGSNVWVAAGTVSIGRSIDDGVTWADLISYVIDGTIQIQDAKLPSSDVCYIVGKFGKAEKSVDFTDATPIFIVLNTGSVLDWYCCALLTDIFGVFAGENGVIKKTIDGTNFVNVNSPTTDNIRDIVLFDENKWVISTERALTGDVWETDDAGATWIQQTNTTGGSKVHYGLTKTGTGTFVVGGYPVGQVWSGVIKSAVSNTNFVKFNGDNSEDWYWFLYHPFMIGAFYDVTITIANIVGVGAGKYMDISLGGGTEYQIEILEGIFTTRIECKDHNFYMKVPASETTGTFEVTDVSFLGVERDFVEADRMLLIKKLTDYDEATTLILEQWRASFDFPQIAGMPDELLRQYMRYRNDFISLIGTELGSTIFFYFLGFTVFIDELYAVKGGYEEFSFIPQKIDDLLTTIGTVKTSVVNTYAIVMNPGHQIIIGDELSNVTNPFVGAVVKVVDVVGDVVTVDRTVNVTTSDVIDSYREYDYAVNVDSDTYFKTSTIDVYFKNSTFGELGITFSDLQAFFEEFLPINVVVRFFGYKTDLGSESFTISEPLISIAETESDDFTIDETPNMDTDATVHIIAFVDVDGNPSGSYSYVGAPSSWNGSTYPGPDTWVILVP